jgi:hypothetical protein
MHLSMAGATQTLQLTTPTSSEFFWVRIIANALKLLVRNSTVPNQPAGVFWAVLNRLLIIVQTVVLILSELGMILAAMCEYASFQLPKAGPPRSLITTSPFSGATLG